MKKCTECQIEKEESEFHKDRSRYDGLDSRCKECKKIRNRWYRLKHEKYFKDYRRNNYEKYKDTFRSSFKDWYYRNKNKTKSHHILNYAIFKNEIERKPCAICKKSDAHAHHDDYSKPLAVDWLCRDCHGLWHQLLNEWERQAGEQ